MDIPIITYNSFNTSWINQIAIFKESMKKTQEHYTKEGTNDFSQAADLAAAIRTEYEKIIAQVQYFREIALNMRDQISRTEEEIESRGPITRSLDKWKEAIRKAKDEYQDAYQKTVELFSNLGEIFDKYQQILHMKALPELEAIDFSLMECRMFIIASRRSCEIVSDDSKESLSPSTPIPYLSTHLIVILNKE